MSASTARVTTEELMKMAMDMVGQTEIPADSKIYVPGANINKIMFGVDIGVAELLVAKQMNFDCVIAHHPDAGLQTFPEILDLHVDLMVKNGVPENLARAAIDQMKQEHMFRRHSVNYDHAPSFARLLEMPFLNIHNPLDELGRRRMQEAVDKNTTPESTVEEVIDALYTLPELANAPTRVELRLGRMNNRAGKTVVVHGAGTNGGYSVAKLYFTHGVDTVIYIHIGLPELLKLKQEFPNGKNLIISGHIASDLVGINPYVEKLESMGLSVARVSGL